MRKILITHASRYGLTASVADVLCQCLENAGNATDCLSVSDNPDPNGYDAVIVGGPIHYDRWAKAAQSYVRQHSRTLAQQPHAFFFTCMTLSQPNEKARIKANAYAEKIAALSPGGMRLPAGQFAGRMDLNDLTPLIRPIVWLMLSVLGARAGDYRHPGEITAWADHIGREMLECRNLS